jgi:hypothetical protein
MKLRSLLLLGLCITPTLGLAQVINGDFTNGTANWTWLRGTSTSSISTCLTTRYIPNSSDVPNIGTAPALGNVALLRAQYTTGTSSQISCTEIQQTLTVPAASQLRLNAKLGGEYSSTPSLNIYYPVTLKVSFLTGGQSYSLFNVQGKLEDPICGAFNSCPRFVSYVINMTQFAGQTGTLSLRADTEAEGNRRIGSPAYVDDIGFEPAPPTVPPTPQPPAPAMSQPAYSGGFHTISWASSTANPRFVLERAIDAGSWKEVYKGGSYSWSAATPGSGYYRYRVAIITGTGQSTYSAEVTVRSLGPNVIPAVNYLLD